MKKETEVKVKRTNKPGGGRIADKNSKRQIAYRILTAMYAKADQTVDELVDSLSLVELNMDYEIVNTRKTKKAIERAMQKATENATVAAIVNATTIQNLAADESKTRHDCLSFLMDILEINKPYASTLYADFRRINTDSGTMTAVYRILEKRVNGVVVPYTSKTNVFKPNDDDCTTLAQAKKSYIASQQACIKSARGLSA